jgi:hypothetical protein
MTGHPHLGVWIELSDVGIQLSSGLIISTLVTQCLHHTGIVARIGAGGAAADLMPCPRSLLGTAAAKEEVVVQLVVGRGTITIEYGWRSSLETDDDGIILLIGPDVSS